MRPRSAPRIGAHRQKSSIFLKLFCSVTLCVVLLLVFNWLLNSFVLVSYYRSAKEQSLRDAFTRVDVLLLDGGSEQLENELYRLNGTENIKTIIWSRTTILYNFRVGETMQLQLPSLNLENGTYLLQVSENDRLQSSDITLAGRFSNGYSVIMQTPMAAIEESVGITNRFLLLSGTATLLIGVVLVLAVSRSFTRPIRALSRVAGSVARLDFSDRYTGKRRDELDDLGNSINAMSRALETTIGQLRADNERKTQESEARKAFIANVSHELKTPIALIQTYAEGLREGLADDEEMRDSYCRVIEEEAQNMSDMIRRMTTLMQLQTGDGSLSLAPFDLAALARELLLRNAPLFRERRLNVEGPPETPVWVTGDASLIENVLSNFLSNAFHHTPEGGRVTVSLSPAPSGNCRLSVYNSGQPIPEEELPRIWEAFYKVDKARTRAYGGSGIGLSVVAAVMQAHRMPYGVQNCPGGVMFTFELPFAPESGIRS